jgi:spore maturation protein CgeB
LFEATAAGAAVITDSWEGLEAFFEPGREMLVAHSCSDVVESLDLAPVDMGRLAAAGRERTLAEHTSDRRAAELIFLLEAVPGTATAAHAAEA